MRTKINELTLSLNYLNIDHNKDKIIKISNLLISKIKKRNKIFSCGNGGSASQASHFTTELVVRYKKKYERRAYNAICLSSDTSLLTAISNDYDFNKIFSRQLEGLANSKDLLFLFSTSGNSKNLIEAVKHAKKIGIKTISFTGQTGGKLKNNSDLNLNIKSSNTAIIQECHLFLIHYIIELVEKKLKE